MISFALFKPVWSFCKKHATKILCGLAVGGEAAALYLTAKEAPEAKKRIDALGENATTMQKIKTAAPVYWPAGSCAAISMASMILGTVIGEHQKAALAIAGSAAQAAAAKYQQALIRHAGKEEAAKVEQEIGQEAIMQKPPTNTANIYATGKGDQLIYDPLSGRYFTSTWREVEEAALRIKKEIFNSVWVNANEWYNELGLETIGLGEYVGWNVDYLIDIGSNAMKTNDGRSCLEICYYTRPVRYK